MHKCPGHLADKQSLWPLGNLSLYAKTYLIDLGSWIITVSQTIHRLNVTHSYACSLPSNNTRTVSPRDKAEAWMKTVFSSVLPQSSDLQPTASTSSRTTTTHMQTGTETHAHRARAIQRMNRRLKNLLGSPSPRREAAKCTVRSLPVILL